MRWPAVVGGAGLMVLALPVGMVLLLAPASSSGSCGVDAPVVDGTWTVGQIAQLWVSEGGPADQAETAGAVGMAESGGDPNAVGPPTRWGVAIGLMQILGAVLPGDLRDPVVNMRNAVRKYEDAHGWTPWETFTNGDYRQYMGQGASAPVLCDAGGGVAGTPKYIVDTVVLPLANANGIPRTVAENDAANAAHGPTVNGGRSDHQGPPEVAWAADMSNGITTPQEDALAAALAARFGIPWHGAGLVAATHDGYRFQLIYRTHEGGDHFNHVHFGVRRVGGV